jgi:hypothetical protein
LVLGLAACQEDAVPVPAPSRIVLVSGDGQYTRKGTEVEDPLVVKVTLSDGTPGAGTLVAFSVIEGGGTLSRTSATASGDGLTSVRWTVGGATGLNRVRISVPAAASLSVVAQATSADFYCPEEDPAFTRTFNSAHDVFLFTRRSGLAASGGQPRVGLIHLAPDFPANEFVASLFLGFDEDVLLNVVRDCAFSAGGDFYVAWTQGAAVQEVIRVAPDGTFSHFATLESYLGTEIATLPSGVLAGCDEVGPFTVGCRDTLTRYADATFSGTAPDAANWDAAAVDPATGALYFIHLGDLTLRRVPLNGYAQAGPTETVATLGSDEANGARGMVVASDGSVYILVESTNTKSLVKVTSAGTPSTAVDFFVARGPGAAAGEQSDLAIDRGYGSGFVYTLDTLNNVILLYEVANGNLTELGPAGSPDDLSDGVSDERVGLAVLP